MPTKDFIQAVNTEYAKRQSFSRKKLEKPYSYRFWYPIFPSSWRLFCSRWWLHWFTLHNYTQFFSIKWQRMTRGYADVDLWNMNDTLAYLLHEMAADFTETHHGCPFGTTSEEYQEQLIVMVSGFEAMYEMLSEEGMPDYNTPEYKVWIADKETRWEVGMKIFKEEFSGLWD